MTLCGKRAWLGCSSLHLFGPAMTRVAAGLQASDQRKKVSKNRQSVFRYSRKANVDEPASISKLNQKNHLFAPPQ